MSELLVLKMAAQAGTSTPTVKQYHCIFFENEYLSHGRYRNINLMTFKQASIIEAENHWDYQNLMTDY